MFYLKRLISLSNVMRHRARQRGQIATFLLLGLVAVLVFAIATANLGRLSLASLRASNTADSSVMLLGSQLATKASVQWNTLGKRLEKCQSSGMLAIVVAIIVAVVLIVVTWGAATPLVAAMLPAIIAATGVTLATAVTIATTALMIGAGMVGGAIGGAIGGAAAGTGVVEGTVHGAVVGAALGSGVAAGAAMGPASAAAISPAMASTSGAIAGGALSAGSSLYSGSVKEQMTSDAFTVAAKALSGLPEKDSIREIVFLQSLGQTVNDPNRTANANNPNDTGACYWPAKVPVSGDPFDANANGNTKESIPCFEYWWDRRVDQLKQPLTTLGGDVEAFLNGPLAAFEGSTQATVLCGGNIRCGDGACEFDEQCGWASQCPADCGACGGGEESE